MWLRVHNGFRRGLETPCRVNNGPGDVSTLSGLRVTCGLFDNGVPFSLVDSWQNRQDAHRDLKRPWRGYTAYFDHTCNDTDAYSAKLCSMMDTPMKPKVTFNEKSNVYVDVVPYSEIYHEHPHFLIAVCDAQGPRWKESPS